MPHPPIIWSIAGHDSSGGAGLSADQRAADALGVHLCPVVAAITAQHSQGVQGVFPVAATTLAAQLHALAQDLPPVAIKTGLLGSVEAILTVAQWVDHYRSQAAPGVDPHHHLALIVDPVLGATAGGIAFSDEPLVTAYRQHLLPRATLITPNRAEALRLLGRRAHHDGPSDEIPALAEALHGLGARSVAITGGDAWAANDEASAAAPRALSDAADGPHCADWISTPQAQGWLTAPRVNTPHGHGTGCTFATGVAASMALGHGPADAIVLAKMLTHHALSHAHAAGQGAGPVLAQQRFAAGPAHGGAPLPWLGLGHDLPWRLTDSPFTPFTPPADGLYGIVGTAPLIEAALHAGLRCLQLRHKAPEGVTEHIQHSITACAHAGAVLFINDHWRQALAAPPPDTQTPGFQLGLHLGQEDLLALTPDERASLLAARHHVMLGLSSHSLWELARAAGCGASTIACGPVQATTTKDMPWLPQGEDNLGWWVHNSPAPVVAIGGLLNAADLTRFAPCQAAALCVVRGLGQTPSDLQAALPKLRSALAQARSKPACAPPPLPHPVLPAR
ncbi:MAG: bifunctional hydroxymethylpyrimidine kinase/phosphomethylpyrimidine kinase [Burkholderiales bacterium]|nr:bifunctional hydroxymethylpyrimidine kinase/phosphomethylpyrimidine kinase [Burkholderiales bacterium]